MKRFLAILIIATLIIPSIIPSQVFAMDFEEFIRRGEFGIDVTGQEKEPGIDKTGEYELTSDTAINIKYKNADITDILSVLARHLGKNLLFIEEPKVVSFEMYNVNPMTALEALLSREGLSYLERDGIIVVGDPTRLEETFFDRMSLYEVRLNHITSSEFNDYLETLGVGVSRIVIEANENTMYVRGLPQELALVRDIKEALDRPENISSKVSIERVDLSYISPAYLTDLISGLEMNVDVLQPERGRNVVWLRGSASALQEAKEFIKFVDDPANMEETLPLKRIDLVYINTDVLMEIVEQAKLELDIYTVAHNPQSIWLRGPESQVKQLEEIIKQIDILQNRYITKEYDVFAYQLDNVVPRDVIERIKEWEFEDVKIIGFNFPEFGNDILVLTPPHLKTAVIQALNAIDGNRRMVKIPVMVAEGTHPEDVLEEWKDLLSDLLYDRGVREHTFTIMPYDLLGGTGKIDEATGIRITKKAMYAEATPDKIKLIMDMLEHLGAQGALNASIPPESSDGNGNRNGNGNGGGNKKEENKGGSNYADYVEVEVRNLEYLDKINEIAAPEGYKFVRFNIRIRNRSRNSLLVGPTNITVIDNRGMSYSYNNMVTRELDVRLGNVLLTTGNSVSGDIVFQIPVERTVDRVDFEAGDRYVPVPIS